MPVEYNSIKHIIDRWDPVGLLEIYHCPLDEYDGETRKIYDLLQLRRDISIVDLSKCIYSIFVDSFGNDVFLKKEGDCIKVARALLRYRSHRS